LVDDGFVELGGTFTMALDGRPAPAPVPGGAIVERASAAGVRAGDVLTGAARVMVEAFGAVAGSSEHVAEDLARAPSPAWDVCVVWAADEPVAAGRRYTADGMTHLSSIATRPRWFGRGYGAAVTAALADDGQRAGGTLVHLGVEAQIARARRLYERLGFTVVGERIADLLL
jgi:ribosomal protein S18 acetylase RimI-like enzyme